MGNLQKLGRGLVLKAIGHLWRCPGERVFALPPSPLSHCGTGFYISVALSERGFACLILSFGTSGNWSFMAEQLKQMPEEIKNHCKNAVKNALADNAQWQLSKQENLS